MEWSEETLLKLIDAYRIKVLLWDPQHRDHFKKPLKADAWGEIAADMNTTAEQCRKKVISLLSSYRREKSKVKSSQGTGKGRDEIYVSRWFAYEAFKFLEDRDVPRKGLTTETDEILGIEDDTEAEINPPEKKQQKTTASTSTHKPTKRAKEADINSSMMSSAFDILKNAAKKLDKEPSKSNEIDAFFTYVAAKVNNYSPETQKYVQHAVFDILIKADKGLFDWTAPNYQHSNNWQNQQNVPPPTHSQVEYVLQPLHAVPAPLQSPSDSSSINSIQPSPDAASFAEQFSDFV